MQKLLMLKLKRRYTDCYLDDTQCVTNHLWTFGLWIDCIVTDHVRPTGLWWDQLQQQGWRELFFFKQMKPWICVVPFVRWKQKELQGSDVLRHSESLQRCLHTWAVFSSLHHLWHRRRRKKKIECASYFCSFCENNLMERCLKPNQLLLVPL